MRLLTIPLIVVVVFLAGQPLTAQPAMTPAIPGTPGDPVWQGTLRTPDGRTFVTDGGLVIDTAIAHPATLPEREFPPKLLQDYFGATHTDEYGIGDFTAVDGKTYAVPNGIAVSATYINFLRRILPGSARYRLSGPTRPVVVVIDGQPVGAFMPLAQ